MLNSTSEKFLAKILSIGTAITTILVVTSSVTDPVNAPKLVALGVVSIAAFAVLFAANYRAILESNKVTLVLIGIFLTTTILSVVASKSPLSQNIYGSYGRNNGFITYFFLALIFLSVLAFRSQASFELIVNSLLAAGLLNVAYGIWVVLFGDFIGWSNPYGNILGTFGNPNFIGAFLGIFFSAYTAYALRKTASQTYKYSLIIVLPVTAFEIYKSHAIQGRVLAICGIGILGFLLVRAKFNRIVTAFYLLLGSAGGVIALLGALQIGPLAPFIYKTSVSLRGQYWLAGWNTGATHPFTGVGMDSFGDWYRRSRDIRAIELPGVNTVVNAAHNVPMDMFAFGGWPLFLTYLSIMLLAFAAAMRIILRKKEFDPIFGVIFISWAGYQLQSIISINQIGLAIWGWLLSGALIAYEAATRTNFENTGKVEKRNMTSKKSSDHSSVLVIAGTIGGICGLIMSLPPLISDAKWRSAQVTQTAVAIEGTMAPSFFNLQNTAKYLNNIQTLEVSNLFDLSHKYALEAVAWNPESFDLWKILYLLKNSTSQEKSLAISNMKRLDPLNPDVTAIS